MVELRQEGWSKNEDRAQDCIRDKVGSLGIFGIPGIRITLHRLMVKKLSMLIRKAFLICPV